MTEKEYLKEWSYGTRLNDCSNDKWHTEECDGSCGTHPATKGQVDLHNEVAKWGDKPIIGLPAVIADQIPVSGFPVEIFSVERKLTSLMGFLVEKGIIDEQEYLEYHKIKLAAFLKEAREQTEREQAKAQIIMPHIGLVKPPGNGHA